MKLRGYNEIKLLTNVSNPIMFLGYPLKLAYMYIGSIISGFMLALTLNAMEVHWSVNLLVPLIVIIVGVVGVSLFNKKYGLNGYFLQQEDRNTPDFISGDMTFQQYIKRKKNNN